MDFRLFTLFCMIATSYCWGPNAELQAHVYRCPRVSGPSVLQHLDSEDSGVERLIVHYYRARNSQQIVSFIPSRQYQKCIEDIPEVSGEVVYEDNSFIQEFFDRSRVKTLRYKVKIPSITERPIDNWLDPWNENRIPVHDYDVTNDNGHDKPVRKPEYDNRPPDDPPVIYETDDNRPPWEISVEQPDPYPVPNRPHESTPHSNSESDEVPIDLPVEPYSIEKPSNDPYDELIAPIHPDKKLQPIIIENIKPPVVSPQENPNSRPHQDSDEIHNQFNPEGDNVSDDDSSTTEINEGFEIHNNYIKPPYIPEKKNDDVNNEYVDSNEVINSNQNEKNQNWNLDDRPYVIKHSEDDAENPNDQINLPYKWHKIRVPRIDSNGNVYGYVWKIVKSPVNSNSMKWSYWESSGKNNKRVTRWHHKTSNINSVYHHQNFDDGPGNGFEIANWLKKQMGNIQNHGNKIPSSAYDLSTVKIGIENALIQHGIRFESGGKLIDADGNILTLDNIKLRPIYVGRSLAYNRILQNYDKSMKYRIPASSPFLEALLVSLINPPKNLGIVPLGITALPRLNSNQANYVLGGRQVHPFSVQSTLGGFLRRPISRLGKVSKKIIPKVTVKDENKSTSDEEPGFRIIGGSFAIGTGTPLANRGRSGKNETQKENPKKIFIRV